MHGKGFIKFEVAFQFFLREMFFKEIKALQNISLFDVWEQYAIPRPFWLMVFVLHPYLLLELNLCLKAILLQVYPQVFRDWKIHVICYLFPFFSSESASLFFNNTFVVRRKFHRNFLKLCGIINTPFCNKVGIEIIIYVIFIFIWSSNS
jgi:hypothetical protein